MKRALKIIGIILGVLILALIALPFGLNVNTFRPRLESELSSALGRKVTVGTMGLSLFAGSLSADDIAIADDPAFGSDPFVRAKSLKVGVELRPLIFSKVLNITDLTLTSRKCCCCAILAAPGIFPAWAENRLRPKQKAAQIPIFQ